MCYLLLWYWFLFFKQKTASEMRISDWSSDVCASDLPSTWVTSSPPRSELPRSVGSRAPTSTRSVWNRSAAQLRLGQKDASTARSCPPNTGRTSCRESVCQYVQFSAVAGSLQNKTLYISSC